jgi:hypothetical protein
MDAQTAESGWIIPYVVVALGAFGTVLASFFRGLRSPDKTHQKILTAEIADTEAVANKIVRDLGPKLERVLVGGSERDHKIDDILDKLRNIETEQEIARRSREEVARQLLEHRQNDRWRRSPNE